MGAEREIRPVSEATLRRLPAYYHFLLTLRERGREVVSTSHIGRALNVDPTLVRKDLEVTEVAGRPKVGYPLDELLEAIADFLGWNNDRDAILVGVGNLGTALLGYEQINEYCGINIVVGFDADPAKVGTQVHGKKVLALDKLPDLVRRMRLHLGIITVPAPAAQAVADLMVSSGITAIWNFAPVTLQVPEEVIVQNEGFYPGLAVLTSRMDMARDPGAGRGRKTPTTGRSADQGV
jgi:redox-sensing transcriptional repressor